MIPGSTHQWHKVTAVHPEGNINVCIKFHGKPSNSCRDILLKRKTVNLMVALEKKSGISHSQKDKCLGTMRACTKFGLKPSTRCGDILVWTTVVKQPTNHSTLTIIRTGSDKQGNSSLLSHCQCKIHRCKPKHGWKVHLDYIDFHEIHDIKCTGPGPFPCYDKEAVIKYKCLYLVQVKKSK